MCDDWSYNLAGTGVPLFLMDEVMMHWRLVILLALVSSAGCSGPHPWLRCHQVSCYNRKIDDLVASKVARDAARWQMTQIYSKDCWPSGDFQAGFQQAFVDVAMGSDGAVPVVPPACYWTACYRTESGHAAGREWLNGYEAGSSRAVQCRGQLNHVVAGGVSCPCR